MKLRWIIFLLVTSISTAQAQSRSVAITVDDIPCANCAPIKASSTPIQGFLLDTNRRMVTAFKRQHIPVTALVTTHIVDEAGESGKQALMLWLNAGFDLGNHTDTHPDFNVLTVEQMEAEIMTADKKLRPLLQANGHRLQFFRFPYNHTGDSVAKHDALSAFLAQQGYKLAACTIEATDYSFASAYSRAVGVNDKGMARKIREEYLLYTGTEIDFYAELNRRVLGYEPPEVLLIHASLLNADVAEELLQLFRDRGYHFISLAEAESDAAYSIPESSPTSYGQMWGYRWAKEKKIVKIGITETDPPAWIEKYAAGEAVKQVDIVPAKH